MKSRKAVLSLILAIILAAGTVLPAAAAEPSERDAFTETETISEADTDVPEETAEEEQEEAQKEVEPAWETPGEDIFPEEGEDADDSEEESEAEIPDVRNASSAEPDENGTSSWLSDYSYVIKNGRLILTGYCGTETDVTVPGSAYVDYEYYDRVFLAAEIWGNNVRSLSFEKGVTLPEYNYYTFTPPADTESGLESFDGTNLDVSLAIEMNDLFYGCTALKRVVLGGLDTSSLKETIRMFTGCSSLTELDLSGFDTSSVADMSYMFSGCSSLTELDLSGFDTSSAKDMSFMFCDCSALTELDLSGFDTSSVTDMSFMIRDCSALTELDLSGFDTSSVKDMSHMLSGCSSLTKLDLPGFDTSSVTDLSFMFDRCSALTELDLSGLDTSSVTNMSYMFDGCNSLTELDLSGFDTSSVTDMSCIFRDCGALTELDLSGFDTSSVTEMSYTFESCRSLTELDLSGFDTSSVKNMSYMLESCSALTKLDLSGFDTSSVTDMSCIFRDCGALTGLDLSGFNASSVTDMGDMFSYCISLTELDLSGFTTSSATDMSWMFSDCRSLTELDLSSFDTSNVTAMSSMFCGCSALTELDLSGFDTSSVTDMGWMFLHCSSLTELDLSSFDTSHVTDMSCMFSGCKSLSELNVKNFDTASVQNMGSMFEQCESLTNLDIIGFDTSSVTDMGRMFYGCRSLRSLVLFNFVTDSVTDMEGMFCGCASLGFLDLDSFDFSAVTCVDRMLDFGSYHCNTVILAPIELSREILLDISGGNYYDEEGNTYISLPWNTKYSLRIAQNGQIAFSSHPSSVATSPGKDAVFTAGYIGVPQVGIWQYREPGKNTWEEYRYWNADEVELKTLVVPASPEWDGRAIRLVLADAWGNQFASEEAWLTVERDISACSISASEVSYVYTGKEFRPRLTVTKGQVVFEEGRDYTVTYSNNINAGTGKALVKGIGDCTGSKEFTFTISKAAQTLQITAYQPTVTTGTTCRVTVSGAAGSVSYSSSHPSVATISSDGTLTAVSPGSTVITAAAAETANYLAGSVSLPITVTGVKDISLCTVTLSRNSYPFTGSGIVPDVTVRDGSVTLVEGTDYTVTCSNNRDTGTASALITGKGNYTGSVTKYFTITRIDQEMEAVISASVLKEGESAEIIVTGNKGDLVFSSSDTAVASVDAAGLVTALSAGEAVITVTAKMTMNYNKAVVQIPVTVEGIPEETGRSIEDLSYSFSNTAEAFGYPAGYKIPLSSYQIIYGENTRAEMVYAAHSKNGWNGNCAGMSAASALMTTAGSGVYSRTFRTGASLPRNLAPSDRSASLGMNLTTFIEAMHIAQYTDAFSSERKAHVVHTSAIQDGTKNLDSLYNAVKSKAESDIPTVLALVQAGGHAVLAYKTKEISDDESRIYIYDPNDPLEDRYITFYKNGGHYTQWIYDMGNYGEWGTDVSYSSISYISFTTLKSIWDNRGNIGKDEASLAFINSGNFAIYDVLGNLEAVFSGGSLSDYTGKIHRIEDELSLTGSDTQEVILSVPTKTHTIVNLDRNLSGFAVAMVDTDLGLSVETTVQEVTISVDDSCSMNGVVMDASKSDNYKVILNSSLASGYDEVVVSGSGQGDTMAISPAGGRQ